MIDNMKLRTSIRRYTAEDIPEAELEELLEIAERASNTGNMQLYSVVITRDKKMKEMLAPAHFNQSMITCAPVVLTFCADANRFVRWAEARKAVPGFDNFETFIAATIDTVIFAEAFAEAAEERGLGICYIGTTTYNAGPIIDALKLPRLVVPIVTITVGHPAESPACSERLPLAAIIHPEHYSDYSSSDINLLYAEKEALEVNKKFVDENKKETLAQVFTDVRYTKTNNEFFSDEFKKVLIKQGFLH